jgi:adenylate cyclase
LDRVIDLDHSTQTLAIRIGVTSMIISVLLIPRAIFIRHLKPLFDVWGDTVNLASRMESHSEAGQIQVSEATYWRLHERYHLVPRGPIEVKGVGSVETFFLMGRKAAEAVAEPSLSKSA